MNVWKCYINYYKLLLLRLIIKKQMEIKMNINLNINKKGLTNKEIDDVLDSLAILDREDFIAILEGTQITIGGDLKVELKRQYK